MSSLRSLSISLTTCNEARSSQPWPLAMRRGGAVHEEECGRERHNAPAVILLGVTDGSACSFSQGRWSILGCKGQSATRLRVCQRVASVSERACFSLYARLKPSRPAGLTSRCRAPSVGASQSGGPRAAACHPAPGMTGASAVLRPACCRQGTRPAARRGVREASGGARDSRVEEGADGGATGKVVLYFLYGLLTASEEMDMRAAHEESRLKAACL
jgi:hypothetical protein